MSQEKESGATISQQDADKLLGDSSGPSYPETIKITPEWKEEARRRPAVQEEPRTGKRKFLVPNDLAKIAQSARLRVIERMIARRNFAEMKIIITSLNQIRKVRWNETQDSL